MLEKDSKLISSLRLPLAVMVVAIHAYISLAGWSYYELQNQCLGSNVAQFFMISLSHVLCHIAVPIFFLISGFLFFTNFGIDGQTTLDYFKKKLLKRIKTIFIPYILWIFLYVVYTALLGYKEVLKVGLFEWLNDHGGISMLWCSRFWNLDRVDFWGQPALSSAPYLLPFWYMRDLMVCIAMTPLLCFFLKKRNQIQMAVVGMGIISLLYFTQTSLLVPGFTSLSLFYFGLGSFLSLWGKSLIESFSHYKIFVRILFFVLLIAEIALDGHNTTIGNYIYPFFVVSGVAFVFNTQITSKLNKWGGQKYSFFIFAFHIFILSTVEAVLSKVILLMTGLQITNNNISFADNYPILIILIFLLKIVFTVLISMTIYQIINKYCPRVCNLLCGR